MSKFSKKCRTCQACKNNPNLVRRIRKAAFNRDIGDESIADIADSIGISRVQLYAHVKNHLTDSSDKMKQRGGTYVEKKKIELQTRAQKELELKLEKDEVDAIEARPEEILALDDYIARGKAKLDKGELKITASSFLAAIKIKNEWSAKRTNNKIELMKTISAFRSGAKKEIETNNIIDGEVVQNELDNYEEVKGIIGVLNDTRGTTESTN